jgi:hypothetical protein
MLEACGRLKARPFAFPFKGIKKKLMRNRPRCLDESAGALRCQPTEARNRDMFCLNATMESDPRHIAEMEGDGIDVLDAQEKSRLKVSEKG